MASERPNIILIMTDQQRFDTIGAWGYDHAITPAIDRLAVRGVSFRQAYCPGATCVASRAAIFTGMYAHNTGVYSFQSWGNHRTWVHDLADSGYHCVNIGKMHFMPRDLPGGFHERVIVENPTSRPLLGGGSDDDWGRYLTLHGQERPNDRHRTDPDWMQRFQGVPWHLEERFHSDVFIGDSALNWIRSHRSTRPVFLQVGFTGPHEPWDPLPRHLEKYDNVPMPPAVMRPNELAEKPPQHTGHRDHFLEADHESTIDLREATEEDIEKMRRHYFANITTVDEKLDQVLDALEGGGYLENSLILFCSDHGELLGDHRLPYKWLMYDPIVHVPLIACWTGTARATEGVDDLVSLMDLGPTVLEAAGVPVPDYLEGGSLMPYLKGEPPEPREFVCAEDNYQVMLRTPAHKLVKYLGQDTGELYDLESDPGELWNRWDDPEFDRIRRELEGMLLSWMGASCTFTSGYKRGGEKQTRMRWPGEGDARLHGTNQGAGRTRGCSCEGMVLADKLLLIKDSGVSCRYLERRGAVSAAF